MSPYRMTLIDLFRRNSDQWAETRRWHILFSVSYYSLRVILWRRHVAFPFQGSESPSCLPTSLLPLIPVALPSVSFLMGIRKVLSSSYFKMAARRSWLDAATRFIILLPGPARNWLYLVWSESNELRRILQATRGYFCARWEIRFQSSTISVGWILNSKFWHLPSHPL